MSYLGFLGIFLVLPILFLFVLHRRDANSGVTIPPTLRQYSPWLVIVAHCVVAFVYTTPWDNYLVATGVWWYDTALVTGITFGYVPLEEYLFFLLQPILIGSFLVWMMRRVSVESIQSPMLQIRRVLVLIGCVAWGMCLYLLVTDYHPATYMSLELVWALPPILFQLAFGADLLWKHRRLVLATILIGTLYLSLGDSLAIQSGTWTIDPEQSLGWLIGGVLPIEELLFFLLTNVLIVFGTVLVLADGSRERAEKWLAVSPLVQLFPQILKQSEPN